MKVSITGYRTSDEKNADFHEGFFCRVDSYGNFHKNETLKFLKPSLRWLCLLLVSVNILPENLGGHFIQGSTSSCKVIFSMRRKGAMVLKA